MLSIIVCSRNKNLSEVFVSNIAKTIGVDYEVIVIDNSKNKYSIFSAYNLGFAKSKNPYLCFVHDDVMFHNQKWGEKVIAHLQENETGIIGLAGGSLATRIPVSWSKLMPSANLIQSDITGKKHSKIIQYPANFENSKHSVILLDGVFLCMRRELMNNIKFDENLSGFHGYDYDISIQSTIAGFTNYVVYDIVLEHFSTGETSAKYYLNLISIFKKWEKFLPLIGSSVSESERAHISEIEEKFLLKLPKILSRKGISTTEIIFETKHFAEVIGSDKTNSKLFFLRYKLMFVRLFKYRKTH